MNTNNNQQMPPYMAPEQSSGNSAKVAIIVSAIVATLLLVAGTIFFLFKIFSFGNAGTISPPQATTEQQDDSSLLPISGDDITEYDLSSADTVSTTGSNYSFNLYGENYELPMKVSSFLDSGWNYFDASSAEIRLAPEKTANFDISSPGDSTQRFKIIVKNLSNEEADIEDCHAICIEIYNTCLDRLDTDITYFSGRLSCRSSTIDDVLTVMGEPRYTFESTYSTQYSFRFENNPNCTITVSFKDGQTKCNWIKIYHETTT